VRAIKSNEPNKLIRRIDLSILVTLIDAWGRLTSAIYRDEQQLVRQRTRPEIQQ
jgi:hypothetical protein